jgi:hypothetical protein
MNLQQMSLELAIVNSSTAFWQSLDGNFSRAQCCAHGHENSAEHFHVVGNFSLAQEKISEAISVVFGERFNPERDDHRGHLFTLAAVNKAQDQISGGSNFVSQRTVDFNNFFKITDSLSGKKIGGETRQIADAKKYLTNKFSLNSTKAKAEAILATQESMVQKARDLVNLGWRDLSDPLVASAGSLVKASPSLAMSGLTLGTAQLILRSFDQQSAANLVRDNIGASTEAAAFFVLVNGVLENLSHSFILAAPAFTGVVAYDSAQKNLKKIYDYYAAKPQNEAVDEIVDLEMAPISLVENSEENFVQGSFFESKKAVNILKKIQPLLHEKEMWQGLRRRQLAYQDNDLEADLKNKIASLIGSLEEFPQKINQFLRQDFNQSLNDAFAMLKAYEEVYQDKNPGSSISKLCEEFCDVFSRDAILLTAPSDNAKMAAFCLRSEAGLVSFEERVKESLPHMPSGEQVLLAATVIGALFSAREIYKAATGEEEVYSDYVINFPDHLFKWLELEQMYENMGGGAELTERFKDFFAGFNLAENSTHVGIAVAPIAAYLQVGSKMFENIHHAPANYLSYAADVAGSYADKMKSWFQTKNAAIVPEISVENLGESEAFVDLEKSERFADASTQTEEKKVDSENSAALFCGSGEDFLAQFPKQNQGLIPKSGKRIFTPHVHGPNCGHK